jgi:hypothetical protein
VPGSGPGRRTRASAAGAVARLRPPRRFFAFLLFMVASYVALVEIVKGWFYRRYPM